MRTLAGLIVLPFVLAGLAARLLLLPAIITGIIYLIFGTDSPVFTWTVLICLGWVYLEWRALHKVARAAGTTRRRRRR